MIHQRKLIATKEVASHAEPSMLGSLIAKLVEIRRSLINQAAEFEERITNAHPLYQKSVANLIHYLALRHHDIRLLQDELAALGLSSLGRAESHTMWTLDAVLSILLELAGQQDEVQFASDAIRFAEGKSALAVH